MVLPAALPPRGLGKTGPIRQEVVATLVFCTELVEIAPCAQSPPLGGAFEQERSSHVSYRGFWWEGKEEKRAFLWGTESLALKSLLP